jgi:hypothetical protein
MREPRVGLYLRLHLEKGAITVDAAALIPRWSRSLLRAPILTRENYKRIGYPGVETVVSLLDESGGVVDSFGFSEMPKVFFDHKVAGRRGRLAGNAGNPRQATREIRIPLSSAVKFLNFHRSELTFVRRGPVSNPELRQHYVALYSVAEPGEPSLPAPPLPVPPTKRVSPRLLPWLPPRGERARG